MIRTCGKSWPGKPISAGNLQNSHSRSNLSPANGHFPWISFGSDFWILYDNGEPNSVISSVLVNPWGFLADGFGPLHEIDFSPLDSRLAVPYSI